MIYGNVVRQYARSKYGYASESEIVSESDAILEALQNEYDNYNNIVVNESYFADDHERMINEARLEVIQEALSGAIIAAIIAGIAALIGIIVAVVVIIKKGKKKIEEKAGDKPKDLSDEDRKKIIDQIIGDQVDDSGENSFKLNSYSPTDFTKYIKTSGIDTLISAANTVKNISGDINNDQLNSLKEKLDDEKKINALLFDGLEIAEGSSWKQILLQIYNKDSKPFSDVMRDMSNVKKTIDSLFGSAENKGREMQNKLKELEGIYQDIKGRITKTDDDGNAKPLPKAQDTVFKATQKAISNMRKFITAWQSIENQRLILVTRIYSAMMQGSSSTEKKDEDKKEDNK